MKIMRIVLLLIAIVVLNVIFADRYLIPTKTIPADQIIYSDESPKTKNEFVLLNSQVYLDETNSIESDALIAIGKYKVATTAERYLPLGGQKLTSLKAVEMPNGSFELTDLKILIQIKDSNLLYSIQSDYGLNELEVFPSINTAVYSVRNIQQINETVASLSNDSRVLNVSFNLVEMTEVAE